MRSVEMSRGRSDTTGELGASVKAVVQHFIGELVLVSLRPLRWCSHDVGSPRPPARSQAG